MLLQCYVVTLFIIMLKIIKPFFINRIQISLVKFIVNLLLYLTRNLRGPLHEKQNRLLFT